MNNTWDATPFPANAGHKAEAMLTAQRAVVRRLTRIHSVKEPNSQVQFVRVMLMKELAAISDPGSTPGSSTREHGLNYSHCVCPGRSWNRACSSRMNQRELLIGSVFSGGAAMVSTESFVGSGGITVDDYRAGIAGRMLRSSRLDLPAKRSCEQRKPTIAKPMVMAAAA